MESKLEHCAVCGIELLPGEMGYINPCSYHFVCTKHKEYHTVCFIEIVQKRLGIILEYSDSMKKCTICNTSLSTDEINAIEETDNLITCIKHREARKWINLSLAKLWFEFKSQHPDADYDKEKEKFYKWRHLTSTMK